MAAIHGTAFPPGERWDATAFAGQLALPGGLGLIDPAGGLILARVAADEAEVLTLAVAPQLRRCGSGRALVAEAMAQSAARGAVAMFLEVACSNAAALALYAAAGFAPVGERRRYYPNGEDALVLRRNLAKLI